MFIFKIKEIIFFYWIKVKLIKCFLNKDGKKANKESLSRI